MHGPPRPAHRGPCYRWTVPTLPPARASLRRRGRSGTPASAASAARCIQQSKDLHPLREAGHSIPHARTLLLWTGPAPSPLAGPCHLEPGKSPESPRAQSRYRPQRPLRWPASMCLHCRAPADRSRRLKRAVAPQASDSAARCGYQPRCQPKSVLAWTQAAMPRMSGSHCSCHGHDADVWRHRRGNGDPCGPKVEASLCSSAT